MAIQPFLIKLHPTCGRGQIRTLVKQILAWQGQVLMTTDGGKALVAQVDESLRDTIAALPEVALIGGVQFQPRRIRRIRVDESGHPISTEVVMTQQTRLPGH